MSDRSDLSVVDSAFLSLEIPAMPMPAGSLALFEAPAGPADE